MSPTSSAHNGLRGLPEARQFLWDPVIRRSSSFPLTPKNRRDLLKRALLYVAGVDRAILKPEETCAISGLWLPFRTAVIWGKAAMCTMILRALATGAQPPIGCSAFKGCITN